jgi:hypothetical protein
MSYTINRTDGTKILLLKDGTVDVSTTDLALFGKGYAGFGEKLNENFIQLLENFANTTAPTKKLKGQIWYDTLTNQIKVWNGTTFKPVGSSTVANTQPAGVNAGDMWYDSTNNQLYVYSGTTWQLIGPTAVAGSGITQVSPDSIRDSVGVYKSVLKVIVDDQIVAVASREQFSPLVASELAGFSTVYKGITLNDVTISGAKFYGTATDSDKLGGLLPSSYLRNAENSSTSYPLDILNNAGMKIGSTSTGQLLVSGEDFIIQNIIQNGDIVFRIDNGTPQTEVMRISDGGVVIEGNLTVSGTNTIINTETLSIEDNIIELNRNISSAVSMPNYSGLKVKRSELGVALEENLYWVWDETFADDASTIYGNAGGAWTAFRDQGDISSPTLVDIRANVIHGSSTQAQYADLAERYATDMPLEAGDVVVLGGKQEITKSTQSYDNNVFGVVSEKPAFLMNKDAGNNDSHPMIALTGRVGVKVSGIGNRGDRIVSSDVPGVAMVATIDNCTAFNVLGRLIDNKYDSIITITECVIGVK